MQDEKQNKQNEKHKEADEKQSKQNEKPKEYAGKHSTSQELNGSPVLSL